MTRRTTRRRPLAGRTILVTRAAAQAGDLSRRLRALGAVVIEAPAIAFAPPRSWRSCDRALRAIDRFDLILLTSVNAVDRFLRRARSRRLPKAKLAAVPVLAIGPATAAVARRGGLRVVGVPARFRAEGLASLLRGRRGGPLGSGGWRGARVLLPRAAAARDVVVVALRRLGAQVRVVPVYRTVPALRGRAVVLASLRAGRLDLVTFASSATARHFAGGFARSDRRRLRRIPAAVIGPVTAAEARRLGFRVAAMPRRATIPDLARSIARSLG
ncbi:MAG TPA: uroporphyrinogen-III synthase [Candidatus Polarisedimenticolia bacterium]|nr:uroporphyrinogen-III synthase [Candidatus Polarisedimenticolia bacterium]